jgi:DNA-binding response OmpR family regulator
MAHIMVLEDEFSVREDLVEFLTRQGHIVRAAATLADFQEIATGGHDVAILDVSLPDGEGFEVAQTLRAMSPSMGIIMLTGRTSLPDRIRGLNGGADHYLGKPFLLPELAAIINALLRRIGLGWRLDQLKQRLNDPVGHALDLNLIEFRLFTQLVGLNGEALTRETLISVLMESDEHFDDRRLDTAVCRLRTRWREMSGQELPLKTRHRVGFSFNEPLHWL